MSTRAMIRIESDYYDESVWLYHHHDGYPEGVGEDLKDFLKQQGRNADLDWIANKLIKRAEEEYEFTAGFHSDCEFVYAINVDKHTLECYAYPFEKHGGSGFNWDEEDLVFSVDY